MRGLTIDDSANTRLPCPLLLLFWDSEEDEYELAKRRVSRHRNGTEGDGCMRNK